MKFLSLAAAAVFFLGNVALAQDLESEQGKAGYSIGVNIGMNLVNQMPMDDLDADSLVAGVRDALSGQLQMSEEEIMASIQAFSIAQQEKMSAEVEASSQAGVEFLLSNEQRAEVTTTASGLQYEVLEQGAAGGSMPSETDTVTVHYHGTLIDGTVFDSSVERGQPASFPLNGVIAGWTEGVQLMKAGDKFRFFIPPELAYGANGAGALIGPNATLIFDVELLEVQ
ncbi:MAG: FKBP-type peptidyl-prolyl cis-trans isomerase [Gammaproteobacteria bacterium]|jgi:FKBP-type peptidyl-prolyl cis-trans isomerase|nr:FKBP-type peptidyl-prolyl cis-trans isomerase [Gammaproteobacteria bacterium]MBT6043490.1 FKBP-type peptidyl-prolyl cis-trans isomerase [Gammaproteobacteria bacterium]